MIYSHLGVKLNFLSVSILTDVIIWAKIDGNRLKYQSIGHCVFVLIECSNLFRRKLDVKMHGFSHLLWNLILKVYGCSTDRFSEWCSLTICSLYIRNTFIWLRFWMIRCENQTNIKNVYDRCWLFFLKSLI
jgi:hypothetical protein